MLLIYSPRSILRHHLVKEPTASGATYAIADVGGAIHATPGRELTLGVTTMPYRAPEVFFGSDCSLGGQREPQGVATRRNIASCKLCERWSEARRRSYTRGSEVGDRCRPSLKPYP